MDELKKYRPLSPDEEKDLEEKGKSFYSLSHILRNDIIQYDCKIRHNKSILRQLEMEPAYNRGTTIEETRQSSENKRVSINILSKVIKGYENLKKASADAILDIRPHTPQGEKNCHLCDIVGMALFEKDEEKGFETYKCQACGAIYKNLNNNYDILVPEIIDTSDD